MQINKTGKLFSFCCIAPVIIRGKNSDLKKFNKIGENIGLLFQISDDLIDFEGKTFTVGKKTKKDSARGKATLISLLGHKNAVNYLHKIKNDILKKIKKYDKKSLDLKNTIEFIINRKK